MSTPPRTEVELHLLRTLQALIESDVEPTSIRHTDTLAGWSGLVLLWPSDEQMPGVQEPDLQSLRGRNECSVDIMEFFSSYPPGTKLTTEQVWAEMKSRNYHHGHSTIKKALSELRKDGLLRNDGNHKGYYLPVMTNSATDQNGATTSDDAPLFGLISDAETGTDLPNTSA